MGGVFAANMTGNTVLAGIAAAEGRFPDALRHIATLLAFFVGAMLARALLRLWRRQAPPILLEAALIVVVALVPMDREAAVLVLAFAMGIQASAVTHFAGAAISTVVVTSTLARTADGAVDALWPKGGTDGKGKPVVQTSGRLALTWLGYLVGAVVGLVRLAAGKRSAFAYAPSILAGGYLALLARWLLA